MNHLFIDTDVILDLITGRLPHAEDASHLFTLIRTKKVKASVCAVSVSNIYYVLRKYHSHRKVISGLESLAELVHILKVDEQVIRSALKSGFRDLEDAIQYFCARSDTSVDVIITRNIKDFKSSELPVMTPGTYIKTLEFSSGEREPGN